MATQQIKKEIKDKGFIIINGKPYKVNQSSPSIEIIKSATEITLFHKDYTNTAKLIERIQEKLDNIITENNDNIDTILNEYEKYENMKDNKISSLQSILSRVNAMLKTVLVYYLGSELYEKDLKDLGFLELVEIASKCGMENTFTKNAIKE